MTAFTTTQQDAIEALRVDLSRRTMRTVMAEYGSDNGQHWAALTVDTLPAGSWGTPGPLVSILVGSGIPGPSAVLTADGGLLAEGVEFNEAINAARFAGVREYRAMREGALH